MRKAAIITAGIVTAGLTGYFGGAQYEKSTALVERIKAGPKRYIVFNKKQFLKVPGSLSVMAQIPGAQQMENINGIVIASNEVPKIQGTEDWVIEEEQFRHTMQVAGCSETYPTPTPDRTPIPCGPDPAPTPCTNCPPPGGTPGPTPGSPPVDSGEFEWWGRQVHAPEAQASVDTSSVTVCVTDTGIDMNHADLRGVIVGGASMVGGSYQDDQGHGTHVAGIIAASRDSQGIAGVSRAKIYAVKVLDRNGSGSDSWIANGIVECVNKGTKIISMSLGGGSPSQIMTQALNYALSRGVAIVAAAGNDGGPINFPASHPGVYAISALDRNNQIANFSSRGSSLAYAGYGVNVRSLRLGGGYVEMSGTSMATPGVAGVFAYAIAKGIQKPVAISIGLGRGLEGAGIADAQATVK